MFDVVVAWLTVAAPLCAVMRRFRAVTIKLLLGPIRIIHKRSQRSRVKLFFTQLNDVDRKLAALCFAASPRLVGLRTKITAGCLSAQRRGFTL